MKKLIFAAAALFCTFALVGCVSEQPADDIAKNTAQTELPDSEAPHAETVEDVRTETEYQKPPSMSPPTLGFDSVREMKTKLDNHALTDSEFFTTTNDGSEAYDCDTSLLYELTGIGDYAEASLEWYGGNSYCITYANSDGALLAFMPYIDEEKFNEALNSDRELDYIDGWSEFTDENSGFSYVITESYTKTGEFMYAIVYCSADDVWFKCSCDEQFSTDEIMNWRAVIVE